MDGEEQGSTGRAFAQSRRLQRTWSQVLLRVQVEQAKVVTGAIPAGSEEKRPQTAQMES